MSTALQPNELISVLGALSHVFRKRFRLSSILWLYAVLASALATFDTLEEYACALAFLWAWLTIIDRVVRNSRLRFSSLELIASFLIFISLSALCYPAVTRHFEEEQPVVCRRKMERIAQALLEYQSQQGVLPPSNVGEDDGSDYSWRTLVLPYLTVYEGQEKQSLNSEEPSYRRHGHYFSGSQFGTSASYFAVTGAETAWGTLRSKQGKISDRPAETILLLEELDRGFDWKEPRDLNVNEAFQLLTQPVGSRYVHLSSGKPGYFEKPNPSRGSEGVNIRFADGSVRFANLPLSEELARALLTAHGGETISESDMRSLWRRELDYKQIYSFSVFVMFCFLPGYRISYLWPNLFKVGNTHWIRVRGRLGHLFDEFLAEEEHSVLIGEVD